MPVFLFEEDSNVEWSGAVGMYAETADSDPVFDVEPYEELMAHSRMLRGFARTYRDLQVISAPTEKLLSGGKLAASAIWSYRHDLDDGQQRPRWVRSLLVFWCEDGEVVRVDTFLLADELAYRRVPAATFDRFISSIRYSDQGRT